MGRTRGSFVYGDAGPRQRRRRKDQHHNQPRYSTQNHEHFTERRGKAAPGPVMLLHGLHTACMRWDEVGTVNGSRRDKAVGDDKAGLVAS